MVTILKYHDLQVEKLDEDLISGLIPKGLVLLAATPKNGKTFLGLQLSICLSSGKSFLGFECPKVDILYIALEDTPANIKKRIDTFKMDINEQLSFMFKSKENDIRQLDEVVKITLQDNPNIKAIIVDPFQKIRSNKEIDYNSEYDLMTNLHDLAIQNHITILLVMHCRKTFDLKNPFENIYGTNGLSAGVDGMFVLAKMADTTNIKKLFITGKDIPNQELIIKQNERLWFEKLNYDDDDMELDVNLVKVMNYIIAKKEFQGTHGELCSRCNLLIQPRRLQAVLKANEDILKDNYIEYQKLARTSKERPIKLIYIGNDKIVSDINDSNDKESEEE